jgi:hypothetical protein
MPPSTSLSGTQFSTLKSAGRSLTSNNLPVTVVGSSRAGVVGFYSEEAIQLAYRMLVGGSRCPFVAEIMHKVGTWGLSPPLKLESRHITYTVLALSKTKQKIKILLQFRIG